MRWQSLWNQGKWRESPWLDSQACEDHAGDKPQTKRFSDSGFSILKLRNGQRVFRVESVALRIS